MNIRTTLVLSFVSFLASQAHAQMPVPATSLVARHSGKCATLESTQQGAQIVQRTCDGRPEQQWRMQPAGNGQFQFVSAATNTCLDVEGAAATEGAHVVHFLCKPTNNLNQLWLVRSTPRGSQLVAVHSQRCLNVSGADSADGARFVQGECGDKPHELFDTNASVGSAGSGSGSGGEPIIGEWKWFNGATITMRGDGTMQGTNNQKGKWVREGGGRYVLTWEEGWIDRVLVSGDSRRLSGSNQNGTQISGERIGAPPSTPSSGPTLREGAVRIDEHGQQTAGHRDCGTGNDDAGCNMMRNNEYPMDAAAFTGVMTALKTTPAEPARVGMSKSLIASKLITAQQLGAIIDLFRSETLALDAVRGIANRVVDPDHLPGYATKFRGMPNKTTYAKILSELQTNNPSNDRMGERNQNAPARLDMRRR